MRRRISPTSSTAVVAAPSSVPHGSVDNWDRLLRIARYAWASPCTLVGFALTALVLLRGGTVRAKFGVVEAALPATARKPWFPFSAITFGHVVLGRSEQDLDELFAHEIDHTRQYERWGALFFVAYPVSSLVQIVRSRNPYWDNHFEVQARERSANTVCSSDEWRDDADNGASTG